MLNQLLSILQSKAAAVAPLMTPAVQANDLSLLVQYTIPYALQSMALPAYAAPFKKGLLVSGSYLRTGTTLPLCFFSLLPSC